MRIEKWKNINEEYQISDFGRIKSLGRLVYNGTGFRKTEDKILKPLQSNSGYFDISINRKTIRIHRLVAQAFIPNPHNKPYVLHLDNNKRNNDVHNLKWGTQKENMEQCVKDKRIAIGERVANSKLTQEDVYAIRKEYFEERLKVKEIAQAYGVKENAIRRLLKGLTWNFI